jgi:hypothetical protein
MFASAAAAKGINIADTLARGFGKVCINAQLRQIRGGASHLSMREMTGSEAGILQNIGGNFRRSHQLPRTPHDTVLVTRTL